MGESSFSGSLKESVWGYHVRMFAKHDRELVVGNWATRDEEVRHHKLARPCETMLP